MKGCNIVAFKGNGIAAVMAGKTLTISINGTYRDDRQGSGRDNNTGIGDWNSDAFKAVSVIAVPVATPDYWLERN